MYLIQQKIYVPTKIDDPLPEFFWKDFEVYNKRQEVIDRMEQLEKLKQMEFRASIII